MVKTCLEIVRSVLHDNRRALVGLLDNDVGIRGQFLPCSEFLPTDVVSDRSGNNIVQIGWKVR